MNVVFTCGGTAGHINPAIAVANIWKERYPDSRILFIGGVQLLMIGVLGQYLAQIYLEIKKRPKYIIKETERMAKKDTEEE